MHSSLHLFRLILTSCALAILAGCATGDKNAGAVGIRMSDVDGSALSGISRLGSKNGFGLSAPTDMWDRVRRGFAMPDLDTDIVRDREAWYTQRPEYIERMIGRSNKYIYHVVDELERRGMPTELALLPFVESAFNPQAVSSAKAAGMWQFIPSTGKHYALDQNMFQDDRRDVLRSTRAALDYLQKLYTMFGDWHLALAAYNWGEGNVQRALQRNPGARYQDLPMPAETRQYVPKLQAIKNIIRNPATFNTALPNVANHPYFERVDINRDMDVTVAARLAEISEADFKALNPAMNKPLIIAALNPRILLPWESVPTFRKNLSATGGKQLASWTVWRAPSNMSVAQAAQQTNATEQQLREINRIPPRMLVKAGSALLVPRPEGQGADVSGIVAQTGSISLAPEIVLRRTTLKARRGDTIASFAERYGLSAQTVANWNNASSGSRLKPGQAVVVHLPQQQASRLLSQQRAEAARDARQARKNGKARSRDDDDDDDEEDDNAAAKPRGKGASAAAKAAALKASKTRKSARDEDDEEDAKSVKGKKAAKGKAAAKDDDKPAKGKKTAARGKKTDDGEDEASAKSRAKPVKGKPAGKAQSRSKDDDDNAAATAKSRARAAKDKPVAKAQSSRTRNDDGDDKPGKGKAKTKPAGKEVKKGKK